MEIKALLSLAMVAVTLLTTPSTVFAADTEAEADTVLIEQQQNETKPTFKFGKDFTNFKKLDKEAIREKLDEMLAEGKITQEKYDAIISGECKPSFDGKKFPIFQNKKTDAENDTINESTVKTRPAFGKRTGGKFPAMKKGFPFAGTKG